MLCEQIEQREVSCARLIPERRRQSVRRRPVSQPTLPVREERRHPTFGMSVGWRDHVDHRMRMLMSPEGPFATSRDRNSDGDPLPYAAPPAGMFADVRTLAG
ncbi:MAG: DUF4913 domain-containing protein [Kineosporiaceae bacterium]|nr:DUF4913 domain-containing protein [Aeromicrobium sp.]